jgi:hypothetical protein
MSIENNIRLIDRVDQLVMELKIKYAHHAAASLELNELNQSLKQLVDYLNKLDQLQPNYSTNEVNAYLKTINLHLDILAGELEKKDDVRLRNGIRVVRTLLKFHPTKYSFFTFIVAWFMEWVYFV